VFAVTVAAVIEMLVGETRVTVPPQTVADAFGTVSPVGKVSVNPTPVKSVAGFGLKMSNCNPVVPLSAITVGLKLVVRVGGAARRNRDARKKIKLGPKATVLLRRIPCTSESEF
jgi:hypothetical protein